VVAWAVWMAMRIAVNCKQHQAYQYGAFHEAFIHIDTYSGQPRCPDDASLRIKGCGGCGSLDGDANRSQFQAASGLSIRRFPRTLYRYRYVFWPAPVPRRCFLENQRVWRLRKRIGTVDSDANSTGLKAALDLSLRCFEKSY
jgi:hypothetical protein